MTKTKMMGLAAAAIMSTVSASQAAVVLSDGFDSYTNGALNGQGGWSGLGNPISTLNPIQVAGGTDKVVAVGASGEDLFKSLTSAVSHTEPGGLYTGVSLNLSAATAAGDYFTNFTTAAVATNTAFFQRLHARAVTGGYQLGMLASSGTGSAVTYGTDVLTFGTDYNIVVAWDFVAGAINDTMTIYVNPTSTVQASNTPYHVHTWNSTTAEPTTLAAAAIRQGGTTTGPTLGLDDYVVGTSFADVVAVPEPTTLAALASFAVLGLRRRSR